MRPEEEAMKRWNMTKGTPKTLLQAIRNGLDESFGPNANDPKASPEEIMKEHVRDFLAQKFQLYISGNGDLIDTTATSIWEKIIGGENDR